MSRPAYSSSVTIDAGNNELSLESVYGCLTIGTSVSEIKIGSSALVGRKAVSIQSDEDNTGVIYLGFGLTDPSASNSFFKLNAGGSVVLSIDKFNDIPIKAIATLANQKIYVSELK